MKTVEITYDYFASLRAAPEVWAMAKHYSPMGENLQRAFVFGFQEERYATGMSFHECKACEAGAAAGRKSGGVGKPEMLSRA